MPRILLIGFAMPVLLLAACSSSSKSSTTAAVPTSQATTVTTSNVIRATPVSGSGATGTPGAGTAANGGTSGERGPGGTRMNGTVKSVASDEVTLNDGSTFKIAANARVIKQSNATASDLASGQFVAITADRQNDNTLLASIVSIFPASSKLSSAQFTLPGGNLMTNATISTISGKSFTVTFTGGGANVTLAPTAQIIKQVDATSADIKAGATVGASVTDGVAMSVTITG